MCIPTRTHLKYNNEKPWFTTKLRRLRQAKEDAYRKGDTVLYKQAKYTLEKEIRVAKRNYSGKLCNKVFQRKFHASSFLVPHVHRDRRLDHFTEHQHGHLHLESRECTPHNCSGWSIYWRVRGGVSSSSRGSYMEGRNPENHLLGWSRWSSIPTDAGVRFHLFSWELYGVCTLAQWLTFISAGTIQLIFVSAGPAQLIFVSAGPAQLTFIFPGYFQFDASRAPPSARASRAPPSARASRAPSSACSETAPSSACSPTAPSSACSETVPSSASSPTAPSSACSPTAPSCGRSSQALSVVPAGPVQLRAARAPPRRCAVRAPPRRCAARAPPSAGPVRLSRAPAGPVRLPRAPASPVRLSRTPAGSVQLSRAPAGPVRLPRAPAGPVRLPRALSDHAARAPPWEEESPQ